MLFMRHACITLGAYLHGVSAGQDHSWFGLKQFWEFSQSVKLSVLLRSVFGFGSFIATMIALYLMPVSICVSIMMTTVFFTPVLAFVIHGEALSLKETSTIMLGFTGVVMIMNPTWFNEITEGSELFERNAKD